MALDHQVQASPLGQLTLQGEVEEREEDGEVQLIQVAVNLEATLVDFQVLHDDLPAAQHHSFGELLPIFTQLQTAMKAGWRKWQKYMNMSE